MPIIKCACGAKRCPICLKISGKEIWMVHKDGETETLMYLDANTMSELSKIFQRCLLEISRIREEL